MLRTLDRYVIRNILPPFLIALLVFTFILVIPSVDIAEKLIVKGVPALTVARVMGTLVPQALAITIPMALLVGVLVGLGRLSADREWVALQACGVSVYRVLRSIGVLGVLAWTATSYVIIVAVPDANQTYREITYNIVASLAESEVKPRVFFTAFPNFVLYVRDTSPDGQGGWSDVFLADTSQQGQPVIYLARHGHMLVDRGKRTVQMMLQDGGQHTTKNDAPNTYEAVKFESLILRLDPESVFPSAGPPKGDREMTIAELQQRITLMRHEGQSPHNQIMEIQKKFSIPVACLVFGVLGLALGLTTRRDGKMASFVLGLGVIFVYYVIMWTAQSMAKGALVPAWLAMWLPNIILGAVGVFFLMWSGLPGDRWRIPLPFLRRPTSTAFASKLNVATVDPSPSRSSRRVALVVRYPDFWMPRPRLLDIYVVKSYVRLFALSFAGLLGIFYISTFIDLSDKLFKGTATTSMLVEYMAFETPQYVYYIIPIATLIGVLVTIGLLTKNSELVVMKACGVSLYRVSTPLLLFAASASLILFGFEERILFYTNRRAEDIRQVIRGLSPQTFDVLNRKWIASRQGDMYHYVYFDPRLNELNGLSIYRFAPNGWQLASRSYATRARFEPSARAGPESGVWQATQGWVRNFDGPIAIRSFTTWPRFSLKLEAPDYFTTEQPDADRMSYTQLKNYIQELRASGFNVVPYAVALQRKLSFPFVTIIMTLIAVPFATTTGRRGAMYGIALGIVLAFVYWTMSSVFAAIGVGGLIAPSLAAWAPNILFGATAVYLLLTVRT